MQQLLFVDDDCNLLRMNRDYFEALGFLVYTAESEQETLGILKAQMIDCIVLNIMLPRTDGSPSAAKSSRSPTRPSSSSPALPMTSAWNRALPRAGTIFSPSPSARYAGGIKSLEQEQHLSDKMMSVQAITKSKEER